MKTNTFIKVPSIETSLKPSQLDSSSDYSMVEKLGLESSACKSKLIPVEDAIFYINHYRSNLTQLTDHLSQNIRKSGVEKVAYLISESFINLSNLVNALVVLKPDKIYIDTDKELEYLYQIINRCIQFDKVHSKEKGYQSIIGYMNPYFDTQAKVSKFNVEEMTILDKEETRTIRVITLV